jgi:hypothetical protein
MILISHRGNLNGKNLSEENKPEYIDLAILEGFDVEVDLWVVSDQIFLGHDSPEIEIDSFWLEERKEKLWIHAKNSAALEFLSKTDFHYFVHDLDLATITSKGYIWVFPGNQPIKKSIAVLPELYDDPISQCSGICSDFISSYK